MNNVLKTRFYSLDGLGYICSVWGKKSTATLLDVLLPHVVSLRVLLSARQLHDNYKTTRTHNLSRKSLFYMVRPLGLEPRTHGLKVRAGHVCPSSVM